MTRAHPLSVITIVSLILLAARPAAAQVPPEFTREYQAGVDAYRLGRLDDARHHLEAARAIDPTLPGPWRFLAVIARAEGKWDECVASAREAIRLNPQSTEIAATREVHDACREALGRPAFTGAYEPGQGALAVTSDPSGASVRVGGLGYGSTPMPPRTLQAGEVEVLIERSGYLAASRRVVVLPGVVTDLDVTLEEDPNARIETVRRTEVTTGWLKVETLAGATVRIDGQALEVDAQGRYTLEQGSHEVEVTAPGREGQVRTVRVTRAQVLTVRFDLREQAEVDRTRRTGYTALGVGAGLAAVGMATGILSLRANDQARDWARIERTRPDPNLVPLEDSARVQPIRTRAEIEAEASKARTLGIVSTISYAAAAVGIGVGAYYLVKARPRGERRRAVTVVPVVPVGGDGVAGALVLGEVRW